MSHSKTDKTEDVRGGGGGREGEVCPLVRPATTRQQDELLDGTSAQSIEIKQYDKKKD